MTAWAAVRLSAGTVVTVVGTLILVAAISAAIAAGVIESSVGKSGVVEQPLGSLRAAEGDRAVLVDEVSARLVLPPLHPMIDRGLDAMGTSASELAEEIGSTVVVFTPSADTSAFVGVGNVDDVNDYLSGVAYSVAVSRDGEWPTVSVPGNAIPGPPESAGIWSASAIGLNPELAAEDFAGRTLVLMRADASPDVEVAMRLEYRVPGADLALQSSAVSAAAASIGGLLLILLGAFLVVGHRSAPAVP